MHPAVAHEGDTGAHVRSSDLSVLLSTRTRRTLEDEGITVLGYGDARFRAAG